MPAVSQAQQRLMAAAEHGATFPMATRLRASMTHTQLHDFAATPRKGLPPHAPTASPHPHRNLGAYLHPAKGPKAAGTSPASTLRDHVTALRARGAFRSSVPRGTAR